MTEGMRKGEALYTFFMKTMGNQKRDKDGRLQLWLDDTNAIVILEALHSMPDDIFDGIIQDRVHQEDTVQDQDAYH